MQGTPTKLSIARFAQILGINPLHFQGVYLDAMARNAQPAFTCGQAIFQYEWQKTDAVGREEIARAIADAEADLERVIGYHLLPTWDEDEWLPTQRPFRKETFNLNSHDVRGNGQFVHPRWGWFISGGIRSVETLAEAVAIVYSNDRPPGDYEGLATVQFTPTAELPDCEIALYYDGHAGDEKWRIRPVEVTHDLANLYTATFRRELGVAEDVLESYDLQELRGVDGLIPENFITTVDVCRVYNDPQQQATLLWHGRPGCASCSGSGCSVCGYSTQSACLLLRDDPKLSLVVYSPADWDATTFGFTQRPLSGSRQPDLVRTWYYSGWRDKSKPCQALEMDDDWARVVAYMAAARLDRPICACAEPSTAYYGADLAFAGGSTNLAVYRTTERDLGNPFGTRRGEVMAWRRVNRPGASIRGVVANV